MDETVTEPWASEAGVLDLSDADLEASRSKNTRVSDPDRDMHLMIGAIVRETGLNRSQAIDRALRVGLAALIDNRAVPFDRDTFDVAYSIPPASWLTQQTFRTLDLPTNEELPESIDNSDPGLGYSTSSVVHEMAKRAADETGETVSGIAIRGARILTGQ
jgi:hypothetical protein